MKSPRARLFKQTAIAVALLFPLLVPAAWADNHYAASLSPADIQAAVNAATAGDWVVLPAGDYTGYSSTWVEIPNGISLRGQGVGSTRIRRSGTNALPIFRWNYNYAESSPPVEICDLSLYGNADGGALDQGISFWWRMVNFKIHNCYFEGFGYAGISVRGYSKGVVYSCEFNDCYYAGYGYGISLTGLINSDSRYGDYVWSQYPAYGNLAWGTDDFVFIEDCTFTACRHSIAANHGARYVFRHNLTQNEQGGAGAAHVDMHGRSPFNSGHRAARACEVYENTIRNQGGNVLDGIKVGGGDWLIYNNSIGPNIAYPIIVLDAGCTNNASDYPVGDQCRQSYIWGNSEDGKAITKVGNGDGPDVVRYCPEWLQENRDFFLYPMPGYTPYPYPHPLRQGSASPHISLSKTSLTFTATAGGSNPASQAFQISNSGGGTLNWTISESSNWLTCSPASGQGNGTVTVNADQTVLPAGTYDANITVSSSNADNSPQIVSVSLTVSAATPPVQASIIASPVSGTAPLTTSFTGSATGGTSPYTYSWNFGDGTSSPSQSPSHTYSSAGNYTATLTVTDSKPVSDTESIAITVTATPATLVASASASPVSGTAPLTTSFSGSATGGTSPYTYSWNFGDGSSSSVQNPSHTYSSAGNYTATLTVTDSKSVSDTESIAITVTATPATLVASASASPASGLAPLTVTFGGSATGGTPPYAYNWSFGDGTTSSAQNPSHTYTASGGYTANLIVTDSDSSTASAGISIAVGSISGFSLAISSQTGSPAPGSGGTTNPSPGSYSYSVGSNIAVKSIANSDYRFSRWAGDIIEAAMFSAQTTITMDKNKSLSGSFCTKCADVNGDLKITPADAQAAFDIFLGRLKNPTWCEKENADVNSSGTKLDPKVTPADAQLIFKKYIRKGEIAGDCSGNSRSATSTAGILAPYLRSLTMGSIAASPGEDIYVPVFVESPSEINAFGFDVHFSSETLTFIGLEKAELTAEYDQLAANVILPDQTISGEGGAEYATLRVGGYQTDPAQKPPSGVLVVLVFRVTGINEESRPIQITAAYDDIQDASISNGTLALRQQTRVENRGQGEKAVQRKSGRKRYNF